MWLGPRTCVCTRTLLPCCRAHAGAETGTRVEGRPQGLARPHSHLPQKQKWQPHQHGCDSSPGETAPAVAEKLSPPQAHGSQPCRRLCLDSDTATGGGGGLPGSSSLWLKEQGQARLLGPPKVGAGLG